MDIAMWIVAGGILGWAGCAQLGYNEQRGTVVSAIIGAVGGIVGGKLVAPIFLAAPAGDVSLAALGIAAFVAAGFLLAGNLAYNRWGV
jgi:uncharacterized membrane protein YeaQ/YmgE (transglycosylase-associated protein family)